MKVKNMKGNNRTKIVRAAACCLAILCVPAAFGRDVFSDAATFRRGFTDADANGLLTDGKSEFVDSLKAGDAENASHAVNVYGCSTGVIIRTETVCYPYANICREEPVAYLPQTTFTKDGPDDLYIVSSLVDLTGSAPFETENAGQHTYFIRYRWDGLLTNERAGVFFNAGWRYGTEYDANDPTSGGSGYLLGIRGSGNFWCYAGNGGTSKNFDAAPGGDTSLSNEWTDCAIVVSNFQLTVYTYRTNFTDIYRSETISLETAASIDCSRTLYLGGQTASESDEGTLLTGPGNEWKVLRGSIHSFAAWPRALSMAEIRQVFAWPRTDLVRLGTANGSSLDLAGGTSAAATAGSITEWTDTPAALSPSNQSFTVTFNVPEHEAALGQVLRVTSTADSDEGTITVGVNRTTAGTLGIRPGKASALFLRGSCFVAGTNTLQLTRAASSGTIRLDAIALGGGIQIGLQDDSFQEFSREESHWVDYYPLDSNWKHVNRVILAPAGMDNSMNNIHFFMPEELVPRHPVRFTARVRPAAGDYSATRPYPEMQDLAVYVNGSSTPALARPYSRLMGWTNIVVEVAAEDVLPGENVFSLVNETPKWWDDDFNDCAWTSIDYFRVEILREPKGFVQVIR